MVQKWLPYTDRAQQQIPNIRTNLHWVLQSFCWNQAEHYGGLRPWHQRQGLIHLQSIQWLQCTCHSQDAIPSDCQPLYVCTAIRNNWILWSSAAKLNYLHICLSHLQCTWMSVLVHHAWMVVIAWFRDPLMFVIVLQGGMALTVKTVSEYYTLSIFV